MIPQPHVVFFFHCKNFMFFLPDSFLQLRLLLMHTAKAVNYVNSLKIKILYIYRSLMLLTHLSLIKPKCDHCLLLDLFLRQFDVNKLFWFIYFNNNTCRLDIQVCLEDGVIDPLFISFCIVNLLFIH